MRDDEVPERLLAAVPELWDATRREFGDDDASDIPVYIFFDLVVAPYLERNLAEPPDDVWDRVIAFIEELAASDDPELENIVHIGVCEYVIGIPDYERLKHRLGRATRARCADLLRGRTWPAPDGY